MSPAAINDGGPAFPETGMGQLASGEFHHGLPGMTLRDHFAGEALQLVAATTWQDLGFKPVNGLSIMENNALCAYQQADAMLRARAAS